MNVTCDHCEKRARYYVEVPGPRRTTRIQHLCFLHFKAFTAAVTLSTRARVSRSSPARKE